MPQAPAITFTATPELIVQIASVCHETNRAYCTTIGDSSQLPWQDAPAWQRDSAIAEVKFHLARPDAAASAAHECWLRMKEAEGWTHGEIKDAEKKTHPCFLPYSQLPIAQRVKDYLFKGVVAAFVAAGTEESL